MADNRAGIFAKARERRLFATTETTFGTLAKAVSTSAFRALSGGISSHQPNRIEREDNRASRSLEAQITGNTPPASWTYECYLIPSGTAGTPPDVHALLLAAMGTDSYTNTGSTSDVYALTDTAQNRGSVSLLEAYPAGGATAEDCVFTEALLGAIVSTLSIKGAGGEPPTITFGGVGAKYVLCVRDSINDATPTGSTLTFADGTNTPANSLVAFYEAADGTTEVDSNSNAGWKVTSVSGNDVTLEGSPSGLADTDIVAPWCPTETVVGSPIPGIQGSMTIEGTSVSPLAYEISLDNGDQVHDNEAFQRYMTGYHESKRRVTGQFTFRAKASDMHVLTRREEFANQTISLVLGTTAGSILTIAIECELGFNDIEKSADDTAICTASFKGVSTSANAADELKLTFT